MGISSAGLRVCGFAGKVGTVTPPPTFILLTSPNKGRTFSITEEGTARDILVLWGVEEIT